MSILVQVDRFEGPLALLLHLIRKEEMDIFDINILQITSQYMDYIKAMKQFDLELAGEFIAMAATLIHIKSRMLLPQYNEEGEEVENEDPRKELVQRLLEYQRFQGAAKKLYDRPLLGRDLWTRGVREDIESDDEGEIITEESPLFSLISSYRHAIRGVKKTVHRVATALQSISSRIFELKDRLVVGQRVIFKDLIDATENRSSQVLVTFLSMLELAKIGFVSLFQSENFGDIYIDPKKQVDGEVIVRVEEFDSAGAEDVATSIMAQAESHTAVLEIDEDVALEQEQAIEDGFIAGVTDEEIAAEEARLELEINEEPKLVPPREWALPEETEYAEAFDLLDDQLSIADDTISDNDYEQEGEAT